MKNSFATFQLKTACLSEQCDAKFPTVLHAWNESQLEISGDGTHFGFVQTGESVLHCEAGEFTLREKMYFCVPGEMRIAGGAGIVVTRRGFRGMFSIGGAIEERGRLRYIDGCTDSLLIAPPLLGDPCLNALYFPENIRQTPHTHPSVRVGIVARGEGVCMLAEKSIPLREGQAFVIAPETLHSFNTGEREMVVIAYHPDSDFGATDENHPMVNMTLIGETPAKYLDEIKTR